MSSDNTIRPLIAIPSPRDIPFVKENLDTIKLPKLWVKYFNEGDAYKIIQDYFMEHKEEYTHLIISPDDLVVADKDYQSLVKTIQDFGGPEKIPVLSGVCNIHNTPGYVTQLAICIDHVIHPQRRRRHYIWSDMRHPDWKAKGYDKLQLLQVKFSGFAFQFIRRDIMEKIGLQGDLQYNSSYRQAQDCSFDVIFSWMCLENNIPLYVNPQVKLLHLRGSNPGDYEGIEPVLVGKKDHKVVFVDAEGKEENDITKQCVERYLSPKDEAISPRRKMLIEQTSLQNKG